MYPLICVRYTHNFIVMYHVGVIERYGWRSSRSGGHVQRRSGLGERGGGVAAGEGRGRDDALNVRLAAASPAVGVWRARTRRRRQCLCTNVAAAVAMAAVAAGRGGGAGAHADPLAPACAVPLVAGSVGGELAATSSVVVCIAVLLSLVRAWAGNSFRLSDGWIDISASGQRRRHDQRSHGTAERGLDAFRDVKRSWLEFLSVYGNMFLSNSWRHLPDNYKRNRRIKLTRRSVNVLKRVFKGRFVKRVIIQGYTAPFYAISRVFGDQC